jgi:3'(2'), 5'-bisphosphate nucleotidase
MDLDQLLRVAIHAAELATAEILKIYRSDDFQVEAKHDHSPLTRADKNAHEAIVDVLQQTSIPVLSEEGKTIPYDVRKNWEYLWIVDPLDGTKEFLKRNDEFTVNIALVHQGKPILGVVVTPVAGDLYCAANDTAFLVRKNNRIPLPVRKPIDFDTSNLRVVASRSHMNDDTQRFIDNLKAPTLVSRGSSLKFMMLAEGAADLYPRYAPTMEWDTAAAHAIMNAVGLKVLNVNTGEELMYNKPDLLNPFFIVR